MQVQRPADALPGRGGVAPPFSARLGGDLPGVRDYMKAYPYTCFEQRTSRAVALRDKALWKPRSATLPAHLDGDGLVKYFATDGAGQRHLTAYVLSVTAGSGLRDPPELKRAHGGGPAGLRRGPHRARSMLASGELAVRKLAALEALSRANRSRRRLESFTVRRICGRPPPSSTGT
jgi:hypothetical protein